MPRCIFEVVKKQKPFTEPHAKSLKPDIGFRTTARFKMWFVCDNSFGILALKHYHKELYLRCCGSNNY